METARTLDPKAAGAHFLRTLGARGFDFYSGVPCSLLKSLYPILESQTAVPYIPAVREDEAIGHAAGAWMAGRRPVVMMQNSGLGNSLNGIVSLSQIYGMPVLIVVTWRGFEGRDAPEHLVMGRAMTRIFDACELPWQVLDIGGLEHQLDRIDRDFRARVPSVLVVPEGVFS